MSLDWSKITPDKKELLLQISEMIERYTKDGIRKYTNLICHNLGVSGRDVGLAKRLMDLGVIKIENGSAKWDEGVERRLKERELLDPSTAESAITTAIQGKIAERATTETHILLKAGEAYRREFIYYLVSHGEGPENWIERDPEEVLSKAFRALDDVEELREEIKRLRRKLEIYEQYLDPYVRLDKGIELFTNALLLDRIYESFGLNFLESKAGKAYLKLVDKFLGGEFVE